MAAFRFREGIAATIVFLIAIAVRVPSCYESFWVDELHSAWCIWDSLADVAPRTKMGNQSPVYFVGLWFWKLLFGGSELALRISSVLMTSIAAVVMTIGVRRWTDSLIAGVAAGLVMSVESNAIFYGTELRPYAVVILCASVATLCFVRLFESGESPAVWYGFVISTLLAVIMQPTSLGVLSLLFVVLAIRRIAQRRFIVRMSWANLLLAAAVIAVGCTLWQTTLSSSWRSRSDWATFAMAPDFGKSLEIFNWFWLWVFPLVIGCFGRRHRGTLLCVAFVIVLSTFSFWAASRLGWVHLWNRRYFIAVLPMFALMAGAAVRQCRLERPQIDWIQVSVLLMLLLGLTWSQGVASLLFRCPHLIAHRGENWRSAIAYVRSEFQPDDQIWMDPGLIESRVLVDWQRRLGPPPTADDLAYLSSPVSGPYRLENVKLVPPVGLPQLSDQAFTHNITSESCGSLWVIARAPPKTVRQFAARVHESQFRHQRPEPSIRMFGGVSVIRFALSAEL
jgi:hypothetical protein